MSGFYGVNYRINGHRVGFVQALNGVYRVIFERCYEENTLEAVEAIDWQNVKVEQVRLYLFRERDRVHKAGLLYRYPQNG